MTKELREQQERESDFAHKLDDDNEMTKESLSDYIDEVNELPVCRVKEKVKEAQELLIDRLCNITKQVTKKDAQNIICKTFLEKFGEKLTK